MTYLEKIEKEKHLLYLIEHKRLISVAKVASDFNCSEKTVKRMISNLRIQGHHVVYCRAKCIYELKK